MRGFRGDQLETVEEPVGITESLPNWEQLSLAEQVAQLIVVRASGHLFDHQIEYPDWEPPAQVLQHWVQTLGVGGVILLGGSVAEVALRTQQLQDWASIPLLISADVEEGVGQRFPGATWFPPPMALNAIAQQNGDQAEQYAERMGAATAQEALAIGINWLLAPVVDVNNNSVNPVINVRAFGDTPQRVNHLIRAFIRGAQRYPILTTAKHFPGHGDTAIDSHLELPILPHSLQRLSDIELLPFQAAIASGVNAVMTAHLQIPALDAVHPATLSPTILTKLLRQALGFDGLIVTDALVMGAITNRYGANEAPVLAIEAGADIVLMPVDPAGAIQAICEAVETGRIPLDRIHRSLERIWQAKRKVALASVAGDTTHAWEQMAPIGLEHDALTEQLAQPETIATVAAILQESMQSHHSPAWLNHLSQNYASQNSSVQNNPVNNNPGQNNPLQNNGYRNLVLVDDILNSPFLHKQAPAVTVPRRFGYALQVVDRHTATGSLPCSSNLHPTLFQLFIRGNPFRGSAGLTQTAQDWLQHLLQTQQLHALVVYGSPYALEQFLPQLPPNISYVFSYGQMAAAQALALETLFSVNSVSVGTSSNRAQEFTD